MHRSQFRAIGFAVAFIAPSGLVDAGETRSNPLLDFAAINDTDGDPNSRDVPNGIARNGEGEIQIAGTNEFLIASTSRAIIMNDFDFTTNFGTIDDIHVPGEDVRSSSAEHISEDGERIAGFTLTDDFGLKPTVWEGAKSDPIFLFTPKGTDDGSIDGMSKDGTSIVGGTFGPGDSPPTRWHEDDGFLPTPLDMPTGSTFGFATDTTVMDGMTYSVGSIFDIFFEEEPVLWDENGQISEILDTDLDDGIEFFGGAASGVSDEVERIVGSVTDSSFNQIPAIWQADDPINVADFNLNTPELPDGFDSGSLDDVLMFIDGPFRGAPIAVATGSGTDSSGDRQALFYSDGGGLRTLEDVIINELGGTLGVFTSLTDIRDLKADPIGGLLLCGMGETADGPRGWVCRIHPEAGAGGCNPADLADPFGLLDLADITAFAAAFVVGDPAADLDGSGLFDLADINAFVTAFLDGCP